MTGHILWSISKPHPWDTEDWCDVARRHAASASGRQIACSFGSRAIDDCPALEEQCLLHPGIPAGLRRPAGRPPLARAPPRPRPHPAGPGTPPPPALGTGRRALGPDAGRPASPRSAAPRSGGLQTGPPRAQGGQPRLPHRRPLADRPATATDRQAPGHWEADLMLFRTSGPIHDRHSRAVRSPSKAGSPAPSPDAPARPLAQDRHLRQRHRVHPPSSSTPRHPVATPTPPQKSRTPSAACGTLPRKTDLATLLHPASRE